MADAYGTGRRVAGRAVLAGRRRRRGADAVADAGVAEGPRRVLRQPPVGHRAADRRNGSSTGSLWGHLAVTLEESLLGLLVGAATRHLARLLAGPLADAGQHLRSLHQDAERGAARRARAAVPALVRSRHLVEGRARGHAGVLRDVLQHLSGRARRGPRADRQRAHARRHRASTRPPRADSERADLDLLEPADQPRIRDGGRGCGRVSGLDARPRLCDLAGRRHVRHDRRLRRHDGAGHRGGRSSAPAVTRLERWLLRWKA